MVRMFLMVVLIFLYGGLAHAYSKTEAQACVNAGMTVFLRGGQVSDMIDIEFMRARERIAVSEERVRELLNQRARENLGWYRNVTITVVGKPQPKKHDYYLVSGYVQGEEKHDNGVTWLPFKYSYQLWARPGGKSCLIGVLAIEELFRLGGWVKQNS